MVYVPCHTKVFPAPFLDVTLFIGDGHISGAVRRANGSILTKQVRLLTLGTRATSAL